MVQSACNLISRFVIRPWLIRIYISFDIFGSWLAIHAQHATGNHSHVSHCSFHIDYYYSIWTDVIQSFPVDHSKMIDKFGNAFVKMGNLGQKTGKVSNWWYISKLEVYHSHYYQPCLLQLTDCSVLIPQPPALNDVIQFPPGQFLTDIDQSVSSPWLT